MSALLPGSAGLTDPAAVGHKFARQELLRRKGFPVPAFFCLPAAVFDAVLGPKVPSRTGDPLVWAGQARWRVAGIELPARLVAEVEAAVEALVGADGLVAVRACAVADPGGAGEDGHGDPFAGLSDSFLYVRPADVPARIVDCWASAFRPEAVGYRVRRGLDPAATRIAVGVQKMVCGTRSFVAFTRDPLSGADVRTIAAAHGIGEGVVQEKADIDHFFADPATGAVRAEPVHKTRMVDLGPAGDPVVLPVPADRADDPVLGDDEVRRICALAEAAAREFGCPQDIEGTLTDDGGIHLLQARPIVLPASPSIPWTNHNITESFPGLAGALTYSQAQLFYEGGFADFYRRMGVRRDREHLGRMIGYLRGQVYYRLDAWYALHGQLPGFEFLRGTWERSMGITPTDAGRPRWFRLVRKLPSLAVRAVTHTFAVRGFLRWWDELIARRAQLDEAGAGELVTAYRALWTEVGRRWGVTLVNSYFALVSLRLATGLLRRWASADLLTGLLCGGPDNRSLAALRSALALAERLGAQPDLREHVLRGDDREVWDALVAGTYGTAVADAALEHLRRYGDRAPNDLKLEVSTPRQQPWTVLSAVRPFVAQGLTVAASRADELRARREALEQLRAACPNPVRRAVLAVVMCRVRHAIRVREDARFCRSQLYGVSRQILGRLGEILAATDRLAAAGDVVHLTVAEVLGAFDGTLPGSDLRGLAEHRRTELAGFAASGPLPASFTTDPARPVAAGLPEPEPEPSDDLGETVLRGLPSSRGRVRARAAVVTDPSVAPESCRDRIIVARETDPGWLFLMLAAKGIVVERGSLLSHTAITGRLLGIPTVVAVPGATSRIADGSWLELDGGAGTVRLADAA